MIKTILKYWYLAILLLIALIINENVVQWALAVIIGGHTLASGFQDAFEHFTIAGYLFFTAFRAVPYAILGTALFFLPKISSKEYFIPVFAGGLIGIVAMILWGSWVTLKPFYTEVRISSTTALAFLWIPYYAVMSGAVGVALFSGMYTFIQFALKNTEPAKTHDSE